ncbi:hypothetical protein Tco_0842457 [Tanacetum coccineum]|uniref:Uncharacterized protein n=1 Tax=Tanacetum coccineum TaxID=301880 RepID=A0ABQ5AZC3_9ASTR
MCPVFSLQKELVDIVEENSRVIAQGVYRRREIGTKSPGFGDAFLSHNMVMNLSFGSGDMFRPNGDFTPRVSALAGCDKKQPEMMPKAKGLNVLSKVALTKDGKLTLATKKSKKQLQLSVNWLSDGVDTSVRAINKAIQAHNLDCKQQAHGEKNAYIELIDISMRAIIKEEVNTQLP